MSHPMSHVEDYALYLVGPMRADRPRCGVDIWYGVSWLTTYWFNTVAERDAAIPNIIRQYGIVGA